jgi:OFA family oxalate/formate antiporter-like MFS transporter
MRNRWLIAAMGTLLMLCLGTVYAWSYFQALLVAKDSGFGWNNTQVAWIFALAIFFLGVSAAVAGPRLQKVGPRRMATIGGVTFSLGYAIAGLALGLRSLVLLYLGYGLLGGIGLGLGYVTPVTTVAKWFPDRKGLATGMVIMGFGLGALFMSKVLAPLLIGLFAGNLSPVFYCLAGIFIVLTMVPARFMVNPPNGTVAPVKAGVGGASRKAPAGPAPKARTATPAGAPTASLTARQAILSGRFALMWLVFFCNITAGIAIISFQSPLLQDLWRAVDGSLPAATLAAWGATLIAVSSLFNGAGRFLWGTVSDRFGRSWTFRVMLATEIAVFVGLMLTRSPWVFATLVCWVLLCYGGGFGTMPAFIGDVFGPRLMDAVYGAVLTAWGVAGVVGPQIVAVLKDRVPARASTLSFAIGAGLLGLGFLLSLLLSDRPAARKG